MELRELTEDNREALLALEVFPEQRGFVASNRETLEEARELEKAGIPVQLLGLYAGDSPVGFAAVTLENGTYDLWRLMVDWRYQGRGYGRQAMEALLSWMGTRPLGPGDRCSLSYEPENRTAAALYHSFGFRETGEEDEGETVAAGPL